jgi:RNA polymerase sigma factor for flagellar operon FliA
VTPKQKQLREELILKHLYIVHTIVFKMLKKFNSISDNEDLISIGTIGLINAVDNYNTSFGTKLSTYARRKIYGAILDFFRSEDHLSRSNRTKFKKVEKVISYLEHELGREATSQEVAEKLQLPLDKYYKYTLETQYIQEDSIDNSYESEGINTVELEQDSFYNPDNMFNCKEFIDTISKNIQNFSERERTIFCLYFYEELSMRKIGGILNLQEARISQLLRKMLLSLRVNKEIRNWFRGENPW